MINKNSRFALLYRTVLMLMAWYGVLGVLIPAILGTFNGTSTWKVVIGWMSAFTMQSNTLVAIWLSVALYSWRKKKYPWFLQSRIHLALTIYITVTMMIYTVLVNAQWQSQTDISIINLLTHYLVPILFILDWAIFQEPQTHKLVWSLQILVYPFVYFIYAMLYTAVTTEYLYPFFDIPAIGLDGFAIWIAGLFILFIILGIGYTSINQILGFLVRKKGINVS